MHIYSMLSKCHFSHSEDQRILNQQLADVASIPYGLYMYILIHQNFIFHQSVPLRLRRERGRTEWTSSLNTSRKSTIYQMPRNENL